MQFFNKKEQVVDLQLTQYGKHLLSVGKLKPVYYAFFDDNILYDVTYADGSEEQNDIEPRIQENTPQIMTQHVFSGLETSFKRFYDEQFDLGTSENRGGDPNTNEMNRIQIPPTEEKLFSLTQPLGTTQIYNDRAPSWDIAMLETEISSSSEVMVGDYQNQHIPQLEINAVHTWRLSDIKNPSPDEVNLVENDYSSLIQADELNQGLTSDGKFYIITPEFVLAQVLEENNDFQTENFDIEVFKYSDDGKELTPLSFKAKEDNINSQGVLEIPKEKPFANTSVDDTYVEYYFDILVDGEIDEKTICESVGKLKSQGFLKDEVFNCQEFITKPVKLDIYADSAQANICSTDDPDKPPQAQITRK